MEEQEETKAVESAGGIKCAVLNISGARAMADPQGRKVTARLELTVQKKGPDFSVWQCGVKATCLPLPGNLEK